MIIKYSIGIECETLESTAQEWRLTFNGSPSSYTWVTEVPETPSEAFKALLQGLVVA